MPKFITRRWHGQHMHWALFLMAAVVAVIFFYNWIIGLVALLGLAGSVYLMLTAENKFRKELHDYVLTLSQRVKQASQEALNEMPIGIILYNEAGEVEWYNPFIASSFGWDQAVGQSLVDLLPEWDQQSNKAQQEIIHAGRHFQLEVKAEERLIYLSEVTELRLLTQQYEDSQLALGIVMLDNVDEVSQHLDDQARSVLLARVVSLITEWSRSNQILMRRMSSDRFLLLMNQVSLRSLQRSKFDVLDTIRDVTMEYKIPITLSIGVSSGFPSIYELGTQAQMSLDIALGRGGDQVAVRVGERMQFYGGRTNAVERRTRVRARVVSHALRELIKESDKVVIMGHRTPDMDALGAAIGVLKAARMSQKEGYIVLEGINPSIASLMKEIEKHEHLHKWFITPEQAMEITTTKSLVAVLDTHKASMVSEPRIIGLTNRIFIADHHRRGEEFINEAMLVYMEPYASSTCELVAELLQYYHERITMDTIEATALLAGIVVDTKSFSLQTGARTFEAASFLRRHGADSALIRRMLKEDLEAYIEKSEVVKTAQIVYDHLAIAIGEPGRRYPQMLIAQVADTLLNMTDIMASFVICQRSDGKIGISARSMGQINVQIIMEKMNGGGHFTNAAAQMEGSLEEAEQRLKQILQDIHQEEGLFE